MRSREYHKSDNNIISADVDKDILAVHDEGRKFGNIQESGTKCFSTLKNEEFPALPGVNEPHRPVLLSDWTKAVTKSNEKESPKCSALSNNDVVIEIENLLECDSWAINEELAPCGSIKLDSLDCCTSADIKEVKSKNSCGDYISQICPQELGDVDVRCTMLDKFEVVTSEDEFNKRKANNSAPLVILAEKYQDWGSAEFSFGFEVNEDLVVGAGKETAAGFDSQLLSSNKMQMSSIDSLDDAILSFCGPDKLNDYTFITDEALDPIFTNMHKKSSSQISVDNHVYESGPHASEFNNPSHASSAIQYISFETASSTPFTSDQSESTMVSSSNDTNVSSAHGWATQVEMESERYLENEVLGSPDKLNDSGLASESSDSCMDREYKDDDVDKFNLKEILHYISDSWSLISKDGSVEVFSAENHDKKGHGFKT